MMFKLHGALFIVLDELIKGKKCPKYHLNFQLNTFPAVQVGSKR